MKKLFSLPPNLVDNFHEVEHLSKEEYFCTSDPVGRKLGSGGGTAWLLEACRQTEAPQTDFPTWLAQEKRILLHAGGQSRRLPGYAPSGKILTPIPLDSDCEDQSPTLLQCQLPLYQNIMRLAPDRLHTLVASGDIFIRATDLQPIPDADVVCYGLPASPALATNHGVFLSRKETPSQLSHMLQKPSIEMLARLSETYVCLMDIGIWLLSDRAVSMLMQRSQTADGNLCFYDLYGQFGLALGTTPTLQDDNLRQLTVVILPLPGGEFHHYGTSREMITSTAAITGRCSTVFVQNTTLFAALPREAQNLWIENAWIGDGWQFTRDNIVTGIPRNEWNITLPEGCCIDVVPIGTDAYVLRPYGIDDKFRGPLTDSSTLYMGTPVTRWLSAHHLQATDIPGCDDLQSSALFPVTTDISEMGLLLRWMLTSEGEGESLYRKAPKLSADQIGDKANLLRLRQQRLQICGSHTLQKVMQRHRRMLDPEYPELSVIPHLSVEKGQSVIGQSPVRIDIAGGWTDTPPFCFTHGGHVVNFALEIDGKAPLHSKVTTCNEYKIVLHSVDFGVTETLTTYEELADYAQVGSPFSIPKAALSIAGFLPRFCKYKFNTLEEQLRDFGCGIEVTLHSDLPAGSGMGTSSILAATLLGTLGEFCNLGWDKNDICNRTLLLEQLLTTGGGWQDQYGGVLHGLKLLTTSAGPEQTPQAEWLDDALFTDPRFAPCHLLYYTGITRTAKKILAEIVHDMSDFKPSTINLLTEMKAHADDLAQAIRQRDFQAYGRLIGKSWEQNKTLDEGTNPPEVEAIIQKVDHLCLGYKLPGAGGGGFLYMVARDAEAARQIRQILTHEAPNEKACFVEMRLSEKGLQVTRS